MTAAFRQGVSVGLIGLLALAPASGWASPAEAPVIAPVSALSIGSDPPGANVYVDGQYAGQTPIDVGKVSAGDHRVRLVKDGYLENGRIVNVGADRANKVQVKLTPRSDANASAAAQVQKPGGGGGGGSKKWLWIGVAGGAAAAAAIYVVTKNHPPVGGTVSVSPTATGMAGLTPFTFATTSSDPDNDSLTYTWNFGDGSAAGSGASPSHTYTTTGTFAVTLSVSDGKESATATGVSVVVAPAITGTWTGGRENTFGCGVSVVLSQSGGNLTGTMNFTSGCSGSIPLTSGSVSPLTHPTTVTWLTNTFSFQSGTSLFTGLTLGFVGTTNTTGTTQTGTITLRQGSTALPNATSFTR